MLARNGAANLGVEQRREKVFVPPELLVGARNNFDRRRRVGDGDVTQRARDIVCAAEIKRRLEQREFQQLQIALLVARHRRRNDAHHAGKHRHNLESRHFLHLVLAQRTNNLRLFDEPKRN